MDARRGHAGVKPGNLVPVSLQPVDDVVAHAFHVRSVRAVLRHRDIECVVGHLLTQPFERIPGDESPGLLADD